MFIPNVVNLRQFYATRLGQRVHGILTLAIQHFWPAVGEDMVLGIGFAGPYFDYYASDQTNLFIAMPAHQGAVFWPHAKQGRIFLCHESELPLPNDSVNRVLLIHSVEHTEQLSWLMREVWRVLAPAGRVLAVVPNRNGLWSLSSKSPLGYGRPFSMAQLRDLFASHDFTLTRSSSVLFTPPTHMNMLWRLSPFFEKIGRLCCPFIGGALLVEAEKQLYAAIKKPITERRSMRQAVVTSPALSKK